MLDWVHSNMNLNFCICDIPSRKRGPRGGGGGVEGRLGERKIGGGRGRERWGGGRGLVEKEMGRGRERDG